MSVVDQIRKTAAQQAGEQAVEELCGAPSLAPVDEVLLQKIASADPLLLSIASLVGDGKTLDVYEALGGSYSRRGKE